MKYTRIVFYFSLFLIHNHIHPVLPVMPGGPYSSSSSGSTSASSLGGFQPAPGSPFAAQDGPAWVAYSPIAMGNVFAAVPNYYNANVTVYSLNTTTGALTEVPGSPFATGNEPATITFTPVLEEQLFAAIPNAGDNSLSVYLVNQSTGEFTQISGSPFHFPAGNGPYTIAFSPIVENNLFAATPNFGDTSVSIYVVNQSTGGFTPAPGSPFSSGSAPYGASFSPVVSNNNLFVAATNFNDGTISVYLVNQSTGTLTEVPDSPFPTGSGSGSQPIGIAFSPLAFGKLFLAVTNSADSTLSMYIVDQTTGTLTQVPGSPFATGSNPNTVAFSPYVLGNLFLATVSFSNDTASVYQVDLTNGSLIEILDSPFATGSAPDGVAYSPIVSGKLFAAVANFGDQTTSAYQVITANNNASPILSAIFNKYC
jgi:6-phosphogluconolactonase